MLVILASFISVVTAGSILPTDNRKGNHIILEINYGMSTSIRQ